MDFHTSKDLDFRHAIATSNQASTALSKRETMPQSVLPVAADPIRNDMVKITLHDYLRALFGEDAPGHVVVWTASGKRSHWIPSSYLNAADKFQDRRDLYFGVALQDQKKALSLAGKINPSKVRGGRESAIAIPGLWADFDVRGPAHKQQNLPANLEELNAFLKRLPLSPSIVVHTGHGIQAVWLFKEHWVFDNSNDRRCAQALARRFHKTIQAWATEEEWEFDDISDLAHLLRLPGTINGKLPEHQPVKIVSWYPERRYDPSEIEAYLIADREVTSGQKPRLVTAAILSGVPKGRRDTELFRLACKLRHADIPKDMANNLILDAAAKCRPPFPEKEAIAKVRSAYERYPPKRIVVASVGSHSETSGREKIIITNHQKNVNDQALRTLAQRKVNLYQRSDSLVCVSREMSEVCKSPPGSPHLMLVSKDHLSELISGHVEFQKYAKGPGGEAVLKEAQPPAWVANGILSRDKWPELAILNGVTEGPVFRTDGSILQKRGYDPVTRIFCEPNCAFDGVPDQPTEKEIARALKALWEVVCDFPFETKAHRSAWLATLLTTIGRPAIAGNVPLFLFDASVAGSGKGLCADTVSLIAAGRLTPRCGWPSDPAEQQKTVTSLLLEAPTVALFDNVTGLLGGAVIDLLLTAETFQSRLLSTNTTVTLPNLVVWLATGNNVLLGGDSVRRIIQVRLVPHEERPEKRKIEEFRHGDLRGWILEERRRLLPAVLTLLRGFWNAWDPDRPDFITWSHEKMDAEPVASMLSWSAFVRGCLYWLELEDPAKTQDILRNTASTEGPEFATFVVAFESWLQETGGIREVTARDLLTSVKESNFRRFRSQREAICDALNVQVFDDVTAKKLGQWLTRQRDKIYDGKRLEGRHDSHHKVWRWTIDHTRGAT